MYLSEQTRRLLPRSPSPIAMGASANNLNHMGVMPNGARFASGIEQIANYGDEPKMTGEHAMSNKWLYTHRRLHTTNIHEWTARAAATATASVPNDRIHCDTVQSTA